MSKLFLKIRKHKVIAANFSFLSILELFRLALPFVSYPYLVRTLGSSLYGQVVFAQVVVSYFIIFVNYGFNISAVRDISINRSNIKLRSQILTSVLIIKACIFTISLVIMFSLIFLIPSFKEHRYLYIFSMGLCLYETVFPVWYFQGVEKMKYITLLTVLSRIIFTVLIFIFIKSTKDYHYVPLLNGIGAFSAGIISVYIVYKKEKNHFLIPSFSFFCGQIIKSFPFFLSRASTIFNTSIPKLIAGSFLGMEEVAIYDLAQKLIDLSKVPFALLNQAIYPNVAKNKNMKIVSESIKYSIIIGLAITLFLILFRTPIVLLLGGKELLMAGFIIIILSPTIVITALNFFLGNTGLVIFGYNKAFNLSVIYGTLLHVLLISILYFIGNIGLIELSILTVIVQLYIMCYRLYYCNLYQIFK